MRKSQQREAIQAELRSRKDHPTAEQIYIALKPKWPRLSLGTVYRNLSQLCEIGHAQKLSPNSSSNDHADRFDGCMEAHCHLTCERCGEVFDMALPEADAALELQSAAEFEGQITGHRLIFTGICKDCLHKG